MEPSPPEFLSQRRRERRGLNSNHFRSTLIAALCLFSAMHLPLPAAGTTCGNAVVEAGEDCDDGNIVPGDCCSPTCAIEEIRGGCQTCEDGIDNDRNGRIDAEDPGCATLSDYQRAAVVETKSAGHKPAVGGVSLPGALAGEAVDGRCDAGQGACACPDSSPGCQALGRPCATDSDCLSIPYPLGRSRAGVCIAGEASDPAIGCRPEDELGRIARAIERIPGEDIGTIEVTQAQSPVALSFGGGRQVVDASSIVLDSGAVVLLIGETDSVLVIRVRGEFVMGEKASIAVAGGLTADHVLWVFGGEEGRVSIGDGSRFIGTVVAPERPAIEIGRAVHIEGAVLAAQVAPPGDGAVGSESPATSF